jgi:hypothetical protein
LLPICYAKGPQKKKKKKKKKKKRRRRTRIIKRKTGIATVKLRMDGIPFLTFNPKEYHQHQNFMSNAYNHSLYQRLGSLTMQLHQSGADLARYMNLAAMFTFATYTEPKLPQFQNRDQGATDKEGMCM